MKIKEFLIIRYGPLKNKGPFQLEDFNLFWGKNEEGKTLVIDALVKLLIGRDTRDLKHFEHIDRVEETPEGYIIIEDEQGKEIKLPEKGNLTKIAGLTPRECRNIFVIRNSDLSISCENEFYTEVTDRLTGLRSGYISEIKQRLLEIGKLTPSRDFKDVKEEKLKTRIENARNLVEEIKSLGKKIKEKRFDELEEESVRQKEEIERIEQEIKILEDARRREKYEIGKEALDNLKKYLEELKCLEIYNENDEQLWRDCKKEIQRWSEEKREFLTNLQKFEEELEKTSEKLSEVERDFLIFEEKKRKLDDEIKPDLKNYEIKSKELTQQEEKNKFFISVGIISTILFGISLLGVIFSPSVLFYILVVLFSILAGISGIFKLQIVKGKAELAGMFEGIKLALSKFGMDAENIEGILSKIEKFYEEYRKNDEKRQEIKKKKENLEERIKELRDKKIPDLENKIKDAENKINEIKIKSRVESLEEYNKKLKLKQELEKSIREQESILKSHFREKSKNLEENILYWDKEIGNLEEYKDKAKAIKYSETYESKFREEKQRFEDKLKEIKGIMLPIQKEMEEVQRKANEILQLEGEYLYCNTSVDLETVKNKLQEFIYENENNRNNVVEVIEIFEEIEKEEKEKVSELFGKGSSVSEYFKEITGGLYEEVIFNKDQGKIQVRRKDEVILDVEKLSGGAYDQLYFSIRLALGEKLLKSKKGFFILDDPFIKADPNRLQRQIETLKKISELGWQIIYFSAKGEINSIFEKDIRNGTINYIEVQSIFL
ncbi:MAG: AAA family ATPase [Candidatus Aenigmatarchaeota archaeon]